MGKTIRIVDEAPEQDRCRFVPNRDRALRARQDAARRNARVNASMKAYRPSDEDVVATILAMPLSD